MKPTYFAILLVLSTFSLAAQEEKVGLESKKEPPAFKLLRAEEDYTYLKNKSNNVFTTNKFDVIKYIPLNQPGDIYLSFGGQLRPRFEHYSNRFWEAESDENFYSQRIALHSNIVLGKHLRLFGEVYHGYTSHEEEFAEYDELDWFQAFAELKFPLQKGSTISLRLGRQEMGLGATRLVGLREGPNIRRSFDLVRLTHQKGTQHIQAFYGKEVRPLFEVFDNAFSLLDSDAMNPQLWGIYTQFTIGNLNGRNEVYYLGFHADHTTFNDVTGDETRHTLGLRRFGKIGEQLQYNSEIIYQFGEHGDQDIHAFNIETDWKYELTETQWKVTPGLKLEYTSGDQEAGDGKVNTFNPMFVNPAYYSLAATITPVNLISIHPAIQFEPSDKLEVYLEWAVFWRASAEDALYRPTRFIQHPADGLEEKQIGSQFGLEAAYEFNRHLSLDLDLSYFIAGQFLEAAGEARNIFHVAPTLSYRF